MEREEMLRIWCEERIGCPYIYGATGKPCTPEYRRARAAQYPAYADKIHRNCPRLAGKASACAGCRWADPRTGRGKAAYDCAQLSRRAMERIGIPMVSGANSQWERTKWAARGDIAGLPRDQAALVFRRDTDHMGHVGIYLGDGTVVHAKGHDRGVVRERLESAGFTHWGQPEGLMQAGPVRPVLRRGDSGPDVLALQTLLRDNGESLAADGQFGSGTEKTVRLFQKAHGLTADGVCGPQTWAALDMAAGQGNDSALSDETAAGPLPAPAAESARDDLRIASADWTALRAASAVLQQIVKKYEGAVG